MTRNVRTMLKHTPPSPHAPPEVQSIPTGNWEPRFQFWVEHFSNNEWGRCGRRPCYNLVVIEEDLRYWRKAYPGECYRIACTKNFVFQG